jgi:hypothetical protein
MAFVVPVPKGQKLVTAVIYKIKLLINSEQSIFLKKNPIII